MLQSRYVRDKSDGLLRQMVDGRVYIRACEFTSRVAPGLDANTRSMLNGMFSRRNGEIAFKNDHKDDNYPGQWFVEEAKAQSLYDFVVNPSNQKKARGVLVAIRRGMSPNSIEVIPMTDYTLIRYSTSSLAMNDAVFYKITDKLGRFLYVGVSPSDVFVSVTEAYAFTCPKASRQTRSNRATGRFPRSTRTYECGSTETATSFSRRKFARQSELWPNSLDSLVGLTIGGGKRGEMIDLGHAQTIVASIDTMIEAVLGEHTKAAEDAQPLPDAEVEELMKDFDVRMGLMPADDEPDPLKLPPTPEEAELHRALKANDVPVEDPLLTGGVVDAGRPSIFPPSFAAPAAPPASVKPRHEPEVLMTDKQRGAITDALGRVVLTNVELRREIADLREAIATQSSDHDRAVKELAKTIVSIHQSHRLILDAIAALPAPVVNNTTIAAREPEIVTYEMVETLIREATLGTFFNLAPKLHGNGRDGDLYKLTFAVNTAQERMEDLEVYLSIFGLEKDQKLELQRVAAAMLEQLRNRLRVAA